MLKTLMSDLKVTHVKHRNSPFGCRIELVRNKENVLTEFKTIYANGRITTERNDNKSRLAANNIDGWEPFDNVAYLKQQAELTAKKQQTDKDKIIEMEKNRIELKNPSSMEEENKKKELSMKEYNEKTVKEKIEQELRDKAAVAKVPAPTVVTGKQTGKVPVDSETAKSEKITADREEANKQTAEDALVKAQVPMTSGTESPILARDEKIVISPIANTLVVEKADKANIPTTTK